MEINKLADLNSLRTAPILSKVQIQKLLEELETNIFNADWITMEQYKMIWNDEFQAVWAAVVSFWFGQRSFNRK